MAKTKLTSKRVFGGRYEVTVTTGDGRKAEFVAYRDESGLWYAKASHGGIVDSATTKAELFRSLENTWI